MTSCPDESLLVAYVDGDLSPAEEALVAGHLVDCGDCRSLLVRSEAALRYALGGLADAATALPEAGPVVTTVRPFPWRPVATAAAALLVVAVALSRTGSRDTIPPEDGPRGGQVAGVVEQEREVADTPPATLPADAPLEDRIAAATARARACLEPLPDDGDVLLAGLAAARDARRMLASGGPR